MLKKATPAATSAPTLRRAAPAPVAAPVEEPTEDQLFDENGEPIEEQQYEESGEDGAIEDNEDAMNEEAVEEAPAAPVKPALRPALKPAPAAKPGLKAAAPAAKPGLKAAAPAAKPTPAAKPAAKPAVKPAGVKPAVANPPKAAQPGLKLGTNKTTAPAAEMISYTVSVPPSSSSKTQLSYDLTIPANWLPAAARGRMKRDDLARIFNAAVAMEFGAEQTLDAAQRLLSVFEAVFSTVTEEYSVFFAGAMFRPVLQAERVYPSRGQAAEFFSGHILPEHSRVKYDRNVTNVMAQPFVYGEDGTAQYVDKEELNRVLQENGVSLAPTLGRGAAEDAE